MLERIEAGRIIEGRVMEMVFPEQANHYGTLFGGQALALMDKAAFMDLASRIVHTGRTSITVEVELYGEDILSGARSLSTRGRIVLVALDAGGKPTRVPTLDTAAPRKEVA